MEEDTLLEKIEDLYILDKHQEIIDMIEALPTEQLNNGLIGKLARAYMNIQNYKKAIEVLKSIEKEEKNTMLWNYRMGCSYCYLDDYEKAEKYFLKAHELELEDEDIKSFLFYIYMKILKQINFNKDDLDNQKKALNYALKAKECATTNDDKIECYSYLGWLYNKFTEYQKAEDSLKKAISLGRDDLLIHSELAYCLGELNKIEEALKHYFKIIELEPDNIWALSQIASYYTLLGEYKKALKYFLKIQKFEINDDKLNIKIGNCYEEIENYAKALEYYLLAYKESEENIWLASKIGRCYVKIENYTKALEYYLLAYKEGEENIWLVSEIGWIYKNFEKYEEALKFLLKSIELGRDDTWVYAITGLCYEELGKYEEALEKLKKALEILNEDDPDDNINKKIFLNSQIALIYRKIEGSNPDKALHYLYAAKELGRDDAWINAEIGWELGYNSVDREEEAIKYLERAIELGGDNEYNWDMAADIYFDLKRYEEALEAYNRAYELEPLDKEGDASLYIYKIRITLRRLERYDKAIEKLLESRRLALEEGEKPVLEELELAYCYAALGDKTKAEEYLQLSINSLGVHAKNERYFKKQFDEIREMINILSHLS